MDSTELDNNTESIKPIHCMVEYNLSGDPVVLPRIGDEYQAEIPAFIGACNERLQCSDKQSDGAVTFDEKDMVLLGLTLPIRWSNDEFDSGNRLFYFQKSKCDVARLKFGKLNALLTEGRSKVASPYLQTTLGDNKMDVERDFYPLPESLVESWTSLERDSFLLALYIFGKNFVLARKFVETKNMGDVLSFYYGNFYGSDEHRRWSDCRKFRSKRSVLGQSIFLGWRQEELSSRLNSHLGEECNKSLLELARNFGNEHISFEEYIFSLKESVGIRLLVEAVAIGKGKRDLTRTVLEPLKANCATSGRSEIPVGKACSSLTSEEIIKFLTGDFRLSKARSSDLFWEAVWPRLLARGWHSEQPNDICFPNSKHSLVFLIPGIKKFSRTKLLKGNHYFDSVTDVLNKVASDPRLLELDMDTDRGNENEEKSSVNLPLSQVLDHSSNEQCHQDLPPRSLNSSRGLMKFTVVDTSLYDGNGQSKVWSLRYLPAEVLGGSTECSSGVSSGTEESSEEPKDESDETNASSLTQKMVEKDVNVNVEKSVTGILNNGASSSFGPTELMEEDHKTQKTSVLNGNQQIKLRKCSTASVRTEMMEDDHETPKTSLLNDNQQKEIMKCQSKQEVKSDCSNHLAPTIMQQSIIPCSHEKSICSTQSISTDCKLKEQESGRQSSTPDIDNVQPLEATEYTLSAKYVDKSSPKVSNEGISSTNSSIRELSLDIHEAGAIIDLNAPHMPPISSSMVQNDDVFHENISSTSEIKQKHESMELLGAEPNIEQQSSLNSRRQSTRARPLTIKALEALECGLLDPKKKRKGNESSRSTSSSKPSRRVRVKTGNMSSSNINISNDNKESMVNETYISGFSTDAADIVRKSEA